MRQCPGSYTEQMPRLAIVQEALSLEPLMRLVEGDVQARGEGCGAVCSFLGVVRATHKGRRVRYLEYEAFDALALKVFERIAAEISGEWPGTSVAIHHRIGRIEIGDASVAIAAAAAHRAEAFQASRYAIERVKQIAPIWKHEFFVDGEAWVEGAVADPEDEVARRQARARACA
jgi:molybdopterin synthase catalytic subunit